MSVLPFRTIEGNGLFWKREESLPDVGFRNYNGALAESYAEVSQQSESLKLFGGDIKVDRAIVDLEGAAAKAYQVQSRVRAMRMAWEALFINGDSAQSSEFDGLAARIGSGSSVLRQRWRCSGPRQAGRSDRQRRRSRRYQVHRVLQVRSSRSDQAGS